MTTFVDIHVLQTVPPSNLNRDDTGSPKSAVYGGVRRARVSSQSWKKATRRSFAEHLDPTDLALRTKRVLDLVVDEMRLQQPSIEPEAAETAAKGVLSAAGFKLAAAKRPKNKAEEPAGRDATEYLVFLSRRQVEQLAQLALADGKPSKKDAQQAADSAHGIEVALFGRMVADDKNLSVDAAAQVAHAISTHAVDDEGDYFTAVDDCAEEDESGAGMLGTIEFNSSTLYRYATVNMDGLEHNLGDREAAVTAATEFVRAFALSMPTGKQNTFAHRTVPDAVVVMVRDDQPVSLVGAFEDAVVARDREGRVSESSARLTRQAGGVTSFVKKPALTLVTTSTPQADAVTELGDQLDFTDLVGRLRDHLQGTATS